MDGAFVFVGGCGVVLCDFLGSEIVLGLLGG